MCDIQSHSTSKINNMEYVVGIAILFVFGVCLYGIVDVIRQLNKMD